MQKQGHRVCHSCSHRFTPQSRAFTSIRDLVHCVRRSVSFRCQGNISKRERESHNWIHTHVHATTLYQTSIKPSFHMTIWKFDPLHYARQMVGTGQSICIWTVFSVLSDRCTPKWRRHSLFPLTYICNFAFTIVSQFIRNDTLSFWQSNHDVLIVPFFHLFVNLSRKRTFF